MIPLNEAALSDRTAKSLQIIISSKNVESPSAVLRHKGAAAAAAERFASAYLGLAQREKQVGLD